MALVCCGPGRNKNWYPGAGGLPSSKMWAFSVTKKLTLDTVEDRMKSTVKHKRGVWEVLAFSVCSIYIECVNFQNLVVFYLQKDSCK